MDRSLVGRAALVFVLIGAAVGCADDDRPSGMNGPGATTVLPGGGDPCAKPSPSCPCADVGATTACVVKRVSGSYVSCSEGKMECGADGVWGACEGAASVWQGPADASD